MYLYVGQEGMGERTKKPSRNKDKWPNTRVGTKSECHLAKLIILLVLFQKCFKSLSGWRNSTRDDSLRVGEI